MKVQVLRDSGGRFVATFRATPDALVSMEPEAEKGFSIEVADAAEDYARDLDGFYKKSDKSA